MFIFLKTMKLLHTIIFSVITVFLITSCEQENGIFDTEPDPSSKDDEDDKNDTKELYLDILFIENNPVVPFFVLENERSGEQVIYTYFNLSKRWHASPRHLPPPTL